MCSMIKSKMTLWPSRLTSICCLSRMSSRVAEGSSIHAGKVAVMTASSKGIGFAVARRLAQQGAHVLLSSRKQENVNTAIEQLAAENLTVSGTVCDAEKTEDRKNLVQSALDKYGGIDYLFSSAATEAVSKDILETTKEEWDANLNLNLMAMFFLVQEVFPHMQKRGGGSIVLNSSVLGFAGFSTVGPYSVSKTALNGLIKVLAPALAPMNIRVNGLAPGFIRTDYSTRALADAGERMKTMAGRQSDLQEQWHEEAVLEYFKTVCGFSRLGEPEECAGIVSFLLSSDASYITGEIIVVGGGYRSRI
ncbi:dehydrogenase/reductase SDR family member 4-like isoform X1 [Pleurodeles waltl]|uniref:dehydrogenase/reductase SDR family member 4-like isoform X1 n=1 Tax=Pleurodeles waltl TaxID=8319 RepID=UPI003709B4D2